MSVPRWDIFCTVIDNFGDIGVTWRLARQLASEYGLAVRLWVDDLHSFACICPSLDPVQSSQRTQGVEVCHWVAPWEPVTPAEVVIEAFGCQLPEAYRAAMRQAERRILWLNLEYLSAEPWVLDCHALASLQSDGLTQYFFFPGFQPQTGGLLREQGLLEARQRFQQDKPAQQKFLQRIGVPDVPKGLRFSLFAYENTAIEYWLPQLIAAPISVQLLVPEGKILPNIACFLGCPALVAGDSWQQGALQIQILPFLSMDDYDRLLWCCDLNLIRGEDSFVRAQWAARPMVWHIYPQPEDAHWPKLEAFWALYSQGLSQGAQEAIEGFWRAWNTASPQIAEAWQALLPWLEEWRTHAGRWSAKQAAQRDLAGKLVSFYSDWL